MNYPKLFSEGRIGPLVLKNRGIMMPMATDLADKDGLVTKRQIKYYQERAKGGLAMIINEYTGVDDVDSIPSIHNLRIARDYHTAAMEGLVDAVHMYDCKIVAQLHHGGATSNPSFTGRQNLAPSAVPIADGRPVPREMTLEDIKRVQDKFLAAVGRCKKAGYDAVELHGAHGYLIAQFFSKYYNRRQDQYGGSAENRARFLTEIIAGIRERYGNYPVIVRMCGDEMTPVEGFLTLEEGLEIAKELEKAGIDAINISNGSARNGDANCEPFSYKSGWKKHVARAYKEALNIPVIATNTIKDPAFAETLLAEGVCDFVGLGRSQLADPDFMLKAATGKSEEIRQCIGCLYCRERVLRDAMPIRCTVNARAAREIEFEQLARDGKGQTVAVIGGGPAGMEAARILALRDFEVHLFEQSDRLGGTLNIADKPAFKDKLTRLTRTMTAQLDSLGVTIRLGQPANIEAIKAIKPRAIIVACGAEPVVPKLPGVDGENVYLAEEVVAGTVQPKGKVAVVGTGLTGLETAEMLCSAGHEVALVEMAPEIGPGIFPAIRNDELGRLLVHKPAVYAGHKLLFIDGNNITVENMSSGEKIQIEADSVVLALGVRPRKKIFDELKEAFPEAEIRAVGDARRGGRIGDAIRDGFEAGYTIRG
ncbi:NADH:flavin oxidoreductase/NADH oxidase [Anaerovibrio sp. JC8]|uniref:oxidoreductase n=1 Tax=Anaerovibrio sp. JC8 TaxID=1240085 RepID=UPI000A0BCAA7|nr:FAD-dependent oxidoreductase [Anaerovibrio sp. JC8]ORU00208.1 NADH:flavin oxidoreductase/NADH oxidase [Anaerovibrio sp. JC8]